MARPRKARGQNADAAGRGDDSDPASPGADSSPNGPTARNAETPAASSRSSRLKLAAAARGVPLPTIVVTVVVVAGAALLGGLAYLLRDILLLMIIAGFIALVLNPFVLMLQGHLHRRGYAVAVVVTLGAIAFLGLAAAFGYPLATGLGHLAHNLPSYVASAQQGHGLIGRLVRELHLQKWVNQNSSKLQELGANLAKPAFAVGKAALTLIGEMLAVLTLVVLLLLEGPRMRVGILSSMSPERAEWWQRVATEMREAVVGYVVGDLLTSLIAGVVVGVTMTILGLPFPLLWGIWVALVDFLPQIGGALAGIPTVVFAAVHSLTDGIILAVVFLAYQQLENHVLNPVIMSRTVRTSPLVIFVAVLVGGTIGASIGGAFGAFFGAFLAVPVAASIQVLFRELWDLTEEEASGEPPSPPS